MHPPGPPQPFALAPRALPRAAMRMALLAALSLLAACDQLGIETPAADNARREAEGRAVGGACRHAGRAIEDCYTLNKKGDKAAIFAGWREMNDYMRENKIDAVAPQLTAQAQAPAKPEEAPTEEAEPPSKPAKGAAKAKHGA